MGIELQAEMSLSTVEAEYVALSTTMRDLIPFTDKIAEMASIFSDEQRKVRLHCTLFEDNNEALELATKPRYRPRTKHITIKYRHFCERVSNSLISIKPINTTE